jgi:hypothetical protein
MRETMMASRLSRLLARLSVAVFLLALAAPQLGIPTVQAKDGSGLDKITWSGTIRIESQSHNTWDHDPGTGTENRHKVTEYQVEGLSHDALNQWDSPGGVQTHVSYHEDSASTEVSKPGVTYPENLHHEISEDGSGITSGDVSLWIRGDGELDRGNCRLELGGVGSRTDGGPLTKDIPTSITNRMWGKIGSQNPDPSIDETRNYPGTTSLDGAQFDFPCAKGAHSLSGTQETLHTADIIERVTWDLHQDGDPQTEVELVPPGEYPDWMPQAKDDEKTVGNYIDIGIVAHTKGDPSLKPPKQVKKYTITLENTSREQGVDLNWPGSMAGAKATKDYDFRIDPKNTLVKVIDSDGQQAETTQENLTDFKVRLNSYDWGGYTTLKVVATFSDGSPVTAHIHGGASASLNVPQDDNENHVADGWEKIWELTGAQADADDDDRPVGDGHKGDSIPLYDEYRGFHIGGRHERLSPITKDLFVLDSSSLGGGVYQAASGVTLHLVKSSETDIMPGNAGAQDYVTANGHGEKVYAVLMLNKQIAPGVIGRTTGHTPMVPENVMSVRIDAAMAAQLDGGPGGPALKITIGHELGHASNVRHHGEGQDRKASRVVCPNPKDKDRNLIYDCPDDPGHPGSKLNCIMVAFDGGLYSGDDACPMRYSDTDFYYNPKGECRGWSGDALLTLSPYGEDPLALGSFCASPAGTGVNDPSRNPPKAGDATLGRCAAQIRLKK